jgi:hypothetical protein
VFFYILTHGFVFFLGSIYVLKARGGLRWVAMTTRGPNDARRVVWAIGRFVSFFLFVFSIY